MYYDGTMQKIFFNKTDKIFILSLIILIISIFLPILLIFTAIELNIENLSEAFFIFAVINYLLVVPICLITQIVTLFVKIFSKNRKMKDLLIILFNLVTLIFFGYIYLALLLAAINL